MTIQTREKKAKRLIKEQRELDHPWVKEFLENHPEDKKKKEK